MVEDVDGEVVSMEWDFGDGSPVATGELNLGPHLPGRGRVRGGAHHHRR
ncbi:MAG: hypothetical protein ACOX46_03575 [Limnochordia bacterium]